MKKFFFILLFFVLHNFSDLNALDVKEVNYYKDNKAWLVNDNNLPIVAIKFAFKAGSGLDSKGKKGTANLMTSLLDEGAGDYSAKEFKKILADNSITLNFSVSHDNFYIDLYTLKENLDLSFQLLDLALTKPIFKLEEIKLNELREERIKNLMAASAERLSSLKKAVIAMTGREASSREINIVIKSTALTKSIKPEEEKNVRAMNSAWCSPKRAM